MTLEEILSRVSHALENQLIPYMITGSVASSVHGLPRSTRDLDIVIDANRSQLLSLMREFPSPRYYADEQQALEALSRRSQFNVIDSVTGWKVDFIFSDDSPYGQAALVRRVRLELSGISVSVTSAEDVLIAKLRWAKASGSNRQFQDAKDILKTQSGQLDFAYVERWVAELYLEEEWRAIHEDGVGEKSVPS